MVVVHTTESTYAGAISWFRNPHAHASAHYVVGRDGAITQMVPTWDIAWHAGNGWVNRHSIGVEHEGYTAVRGTITDAEYRSSAQLVAALLRRSVLPIDRRHVIGHNEVPDPVHPWLTGGYSHHTDPGRFWDWRRYLSYIRSYARGITPPSPVFDVVTTGVGFGQTIAGAVRFEAVPTGETADHVDLLVDGRAGETVRTPPFLLAGGAWDTRLISNGQHVLTAHAVATDGRSANSSIVVTVENPPVRIKSVNVADAQIVGGSVHWAATITGAPSRVEFLVDDVVRSTETQRPYAFDWDTTGAANGLHTLLVRAIRSDGKTLASRSIVVVVANG
jgi:N-acetylmuramoyl-L-alanine amidase/Bacterial Ig domain